MTSVARLTLLAVLNEAADAVAAALGRSTSGGRPGTRVDQYLSDLMADAAALAVLDRAGLGVVSEEAGVPAPTETSSWCSIRSTARPTPRVGVPWYATSLCAIESWTRRRRGRRISPTARALTRWRGRGPRRDGVLIRPSSCERIDESIIGLSGYPPRRFGWKQYRCLGAAALDLCAVACGMFDGFVDCSVDAQRRGITSVASSCAPRPARWWPRRSIASLW